eukprot:scaffold5540_cov96-Cylindrotheca_fusiformis.AAC.4
MIINMLFSQYCEWSSCVACRGQTERGRRGRSDVLVIVVHHEPSASSATWQSSIAIAHNEGDK